MDPALTQILLVRKDACCGSGPGASYCEATVLPTESLPCLLLMTQ